MATEQRIVIETITVMAMSGLTSSVMMVLLVRWCDGDEAVDHSDYDSTAKGDYE